MDLGHVYTEKEVWKEEVKQSSAGQAEEMLISMHSFI